MRLECDVDISAPPETVFQWIDEPELIKQWMTGLEETTYVGPVDRDQPVGARFRQKIREGRRVVEYDGEVTAYDKPHYLAVRITGSHFRVDVGYALSPTPTGTRLHYLANMNSEKWWVRALMKLVAKFNRGMARQFMRNLKKVVEKDAR